MQASTKCRAMFEVLDADPRKFIFRTGTVGGGESGVTRIHHRNDPQGRIVDIIGAETTIDPRNFAAQAQALGVPVDAVITAGHEVGHIYGSHVLVGLGAGRLCAERCAMRIENGIREEMGLPLRP
jgi:hypothetical protein